MQKINFQNLPNTTTPINATNLNAIQTNAETAINAVESDVNGLLSYSTTEKVVGKWTDNKPVYRKVVVYAPTSVIGATGTTTEINIPHGISNFRSAIKCIGTKGYTNYILPVLSSSTGTTITGATLIKQVDATNIIFRIINDTWSPDTWRFIIEYTKTTD